jgi:predicted CopG family antitoxin
MLNKIENGRSKLKLIAVSEENYYALKDYGKAGDSFNDAVTELLKIGGKR